MTEEWDSKGYPGSYLDGFKLPDEEAVEKVIKHLEPDYPVIGIQFEADRHGVIVHLKREYSLSQVNWAEPGKIPNDYLQEGYASTFWRFYGPDDQQIRRAQLLADRLGVDFGKRPPDDMISFSGFGFEVERPTTGIFAR